MDNIITCSANIEAFPENTSGGNCDSKKDKKTCFKMIANAGSRMTHSDGDYVVNMKGNIEAQQGKLPILFSHNPSSPIGYADSFEVKNGELVLSGVIAFEETSDDAKRFVESASKGFPWQASIGYYPVKYREVKEGESIEVNGRKEFGKVRIVDHALICESSVVVWGADSKTSTVLSAQQGVANLENNEEKNAPQVASNELASNEFEVAKNEELGTLNASAQNSDETINAEVEKLRQAQAAEIARINEIKRVADQYGNNQFVEKAVSEGWDVMKFELETLRASRPAAPAIHTANKDVSEEALEIVAIRSAGMEPTAKKYGDASYQAADRLGSVGLQEFCQLASGVQLPNANRRPMGDWLQAAFSTQKLEYVLKRSFNAVLLETFWNTKSSWRKVFKIGRVNDFKTYDRYRMNPIDFEFEQRADGGKYKHAELADQRYQVNADEYGKMYSITRKDIINDDMGVFSQLSTMIGYGCAQTLNKKCWSLFMNPATESDTKAFYHADHTSLLTSTPLTLENLSKARSAFMKKTVEGGNGNLLGIEPKRLIVPRALEDKALMLTKATLLNNGTTDFTSANYNPQVNRWEVVVSDELQNSTYTNYSETAWYLAANPSQLAAFEIVFLNGQDAPTIKQASADFDTEGIQIKGSIDFGLSQQDHRAIMKVTA